MRKSFLGVFLALLGVAAFATQTLAADWPTSVDTMLAQAREGIRTVDIAEYLKVVESKDAMIIDVREPDEYAAGHVPGAINIPRGKLEFDIWKNVGYPDVDYSREIYVQCKTGKRATLAARTLKNLGFKNPVIVLMNVAAWEMAGNPVVAPFSSKSD